MHGAAKTVGNRKASLAQPWPLGLKSAFQLVQGKGGSSAGKAPVSFIVLARASCWRGTVSADDLPTTVSRFPKSAVLQSTPDTAQPRSMRSLSAGVLRDAAKCAYGMR